MRCVTTDKVIDALHGKLVCSVASFAKKFSSAEVWVDFGIPYETYVRKSMFRFVEICCADDQAQSAQIVVKYVFQDATFARTVDKKVGTVDISCGNPWTLLVEA